MQAGVRRLVGVGTCFEYDLAQGVLRIDTPLRPQTLYAACKASTFQVLGQLLPTAGVEFAWCRLFYLHGEGEDSRQLVPYLRQKLSAGEPAELTSGNQIRDFLDVREAGAIIAEAALGDRQGPINVCSGVPITGAPIGRADRGRVRTARPAPVRCPTRQSVRSALRGWRARQAQTMTNAQSFASALCGGCLPDLSKPNVPDGGGGQGLPEGRYPTSRGTRNRIGLQRGLSTRINAVRCALSERTSRQPFVSRPLGRSGRDR